DVPIHSGLFLPDFKWLVGRELITQAMPGRLADVGHLIDEVSHDGSPEEWIYWIEKEWPQCRHWWLLSTVSSMTWPRVAPVAQPIAPPAKAPSTAAVMLFREEVWAVALRPMAAPAAAPLAAPENELAIPKHVPKAPPSFLARFLVWVLGEPQRGQKMMPRKVCGACCSPGGGVTKDSDIETP